MKDYYIKLLLLLTIFYLLFNTFLYSNYNTDQIKNESNGNIQVNRILKNSIDLKLSNDDFFKNNISDVRNNDISLLNKNKKHNKTIDTTNSYIALRIKKLKNERNISFLNRGELLFLEKACYSCHGEYGKGGVVNPNYAKLTIPDLITLAKKMKIGNKEEADKLIVVLEKGTELEKLNDNPPFSNYNRFYAQYNSITNKINDGASKLQKADTNSIDPPLMMPPWKGILTQKDINSIIAYFISIYNWEDD